VSSVKAVIGQAWQPAFRHSAGRLGSHFIRAIRDDRQLLGWKTERLGVTVPPIGAGEAGEWVKIGPGATLIGYTPPDDVGQGAIEAGKVFAAVKLDGADTVLHVLLSCANPQMLSAGMRLQANFDDMPAGGSVLPGFELEAAAS
jgi:uncharacterized OB-fold protein